MPMYVPTVQSRTFVWKRMLSPHFPHFLNTLRSVSQQPTTLPQRLFAALIHIVCALNLFKKAKEKVKNSWNGSEKNVQPKVRVWADREKVYRRRLGSHDPFGRFLFWERIWAEKLLGHRVHPLWVSGPACKWLNQNNQTGDCSREIGIGNLIPNSHLSRWSSGRAPSSNHLTDEGLSDLWRHGFKSVADRALFLFAYSEDLAYKCVHLYADVCSDRTIAYICMKAYALSPLSPLFEHLKVCISTTNNPPSTLVRCLDTHCLCAQPFQESKRKSQKLMKWERKECSA